MRVGRFGMPYQTARKLVQLGAGKLTTELRTNGFGSDEWFVAEAKS